MKKILSLLLGITLVLTLVGCHKDKTTTKQTTTENEKTTETKTTTEPKITENPYIDPWYEDEYREITDFYAEGSSEVFSLSQRNDLMTIKMSDTETIEKSTGVWYYNTPDDEGNTAQVYWRDYYYNPVQKKVKIQRTIILVKYYEKGELGGNIVMNYAEFNRYYIEGVDPDPLYYTDLEIIDVSDMTLKLVHYK